MGWTTTYDDDNTDAVVVPQTNSPLYQQNWQNHMHCMTLLAAVISKLICTLMFFGLYVRNRTCSKMITIKQSALLIASMTF